MASASFFLVFLGGGAFFSHNDGTRISETTILGHDLSVRVSDACTADLAPMSSIIPNETAESGARFVAEDLAQLQQFVQHLRGRRLPDLAQHELQEGCLERLIRCAGIDAMGGMVRDNCAAALGRAQELVKQGCVAERPLQDPCVMHQVDMFATHGIGALASPPLTAAAQALAVRLRSAPRVHRGGPQ